MLANFNVLNFMINIGRTIILINFISCHHALNHRANNAEIYEFLVSDGIHVLSDYPRFHAQEKASTNNIHKLNEIYNFNEDKDIGDIDSPFKNKAVSNVKKTMVNNNMYHVLNKDRNKIPLLKQTISHIDTKIVHDDDKFSQANTKNIHAHNVKEHIAKTKQRTIDGVNNIILPTFAVAHPLPGHKFINSHQLGHRLESLIIPNIQTLIVPMASHVFGNGGSYTRRLSSLKDLSKNQPLSKISQKNEEDINLFAPVGGFGVGSSFGGPGSGHGYYV